MEKFKNWLNEKMKRAGEMFHKIGFWAVILILIGMIVGGYGMRSYQKIQMDDSILLGGFVYEKKVYDIKPRVQ